MSKQERVAELRASRNRHKKRGILFGLGGCLGCSAAPFLGLFGFFTLLMAAKGASMGWKGQEDQSGPFWLFLGAVLGIAGCVFVTKGLSRRRLAKADRLAADSLEKSLAEELSRLEQKDQADGID